MSVVVPCGTLNAGGLIFRSSPVPQDPVAVEVGDGDGDVDGVGELVGELDGLLPTEVVAVQVTEAGAALVPL
jgi:hypothetical protein